MPVGPGGFLMFNQKGDRKRSYLEDLMRQAGNGGLSEDSEFT